MVQTARQPTTTSLLCNKASFTNKYFEHSLCTGIVSVTKHGAPNEYTDQAEREIDHHIQEPAIALTITHM
jgi:hypothetical protein